MDKIAKAIVAAVTALAGTVVTAAVPDGSVTTVEYVLIATATIAAFFGVWATTNAPKA